MTTSGAPVNAGAAASAAAAAAARMARTNSAAAAAAGAGLSNAQAIQMQMNQQASAATQLQQRAAAAAQYLNSGQRKATTRDVQTMLEKNDAALRAWSYLHAQQPPKHLIPEHKAWAHKCLALRQQIGARLEVLASLADKQVAQEDATSKTASASQDAPAVVAAPSAAVKKATPARPKAAPQPATIKPEIATVNQAHAQPPQSQAFAHQTRQTQQMTGTTTGPAPVVSSGFQDSAMQNVGQTSANANAGMFFNPGAPSTTGAFSSSSVASTAAAATSATSMPTVSSSQPFNPQAYTSAAGYMGVAQQQGNATTFMNQPNQANFMMGNAMNMQAAGMMNPQFIGMQMAGQMPMAMNGGAMYNSNMFAPGGYVGMNANHLPADPFNASFQMQPAAGFSVPYGMVGNAQMMGAMGGFMPMQNAQMMMNPMAYNMGATPQQQQQQQQFQSSQMQASGFPTPQQQQQQQQQQQLQQGQVPTQPQPLQVSTTFSDDDSNIFDGLTDDAFLNME